MEETDTMRWEITEREIVWQGFFRMERLRLRHELFAGGWGPAISRELFERGHAVAVLPYDPVRDRLVLLEQFRVGALGTGEFPWLLEIVAGMIEPGESPAEVARREALEEAGCGIRELVPLYRYYPSPGGSSETIRLFLGRVDSRGLGGIHGLDAEDEDIRVRVVERATAMEWLAAGRIDSAAPIIALQWLALHREALLRDDQ